MSPTPSKPKRSRQQLADYRASFWSKVVLINKILPGTVTLSIHDLKALSLADRLAFFDAVEDLAHEMNQQASSSRNGD